jgi:hypothetical protein
MLFFILCWLLIKVWNHIGSDAICSRQYKFCTGYLFTFDNHERYITIFFASNECGGWDIDTLSSIQLHHGSYLPVIGRVLRFAYELQLWYLCYLCDHSLLLCRFHISKTKFPCVNDMVSNFLTNLLNCYFIFPIILIFSILLYFLLNNMRAF